MDIQNVPGLSSPLPIQTPEQAGKAAPEEVNVPDMVPVPPLPEDRVDFSGTTPLPPIHEATRSEEFQFIRTALHRLPGTSLERMESIREKIKSGFYTRGQVLTHIAGRLADELQGTLPDDPLAPPSEQPVPPESDIDV